MKALLLVVLCAVACKPKEVGIQTVEPEISFEPGSCEASRAAALSAVEKALEDAATCEQDEDCTTVSLTTKCQGACWAPIAAAKHDDVEALIARASEAHCADYRERGCPYMTPMCLQPVLACVEGTCQMSYP